MAFYKIFSIPKGYEATLTADEFVTVGIYGRVAEPGSGTQYTPSEILAEASAVVGPFNEDRDYFISSDNGLISYSLAYSGIFSQEDDAGDVEGPASATDNALVRFDATTGKLIQNSVAIVSDAGAMTGIVSLVANGNIAAGKSGTAGTLSSFPATASKGSLKLVGVANSGNTDVTISNASMGQASVITIPDPAAATDEFVLKAANDTALALKAPLASPTFTGTVALPVVTVTKANGTESANAVTASGSAGVITTSALSTAAGAVYSITWTNTAITTASVIQLTHLGGTNTKYITFKVVPGSGTATLSIQNIDLLAALDGTVLIGYLVI